MKVRAFAVLLGLALCLAPDRAAAEWRRLDSPNFIVIGETSERELKNIAVQFEGFRETLGRVISAKVTATVVPTVVVVFPHDRAYTPYKPLYKGKPVDVGGVFYSGAAANYITLLSDVGDERLRVLFHEYAHLMVSNVIMNLPTWLSEGLAEYYSTYSYTRGGREAVIGRPVDSHLQRLREVRLLPMSELIAVDHDSPLYNEGERRSVFYAQSWAVTHMLLHGKPARGKELATFMAAVQRGTNTAEAWRQAFGGSDFDRDLRNYIQPYEFKAYRAKFEEAVARVDAAARPMAQPEVSAFLAGLRLRQQRTDEAALLADAALKSESAHAHVNVAKAQVDLAKGNRDAAAARLTAMEPSDDWLVRYMAGTTLTESIDRETDVPADRLAAARAHFAAVAKVREVPNALAAQVRLDFVGRNRPNAESRANIERARILAPGRADYAIIHAHVLTELGDFALARAVLGPMLSPSAQPHVRTRATSLMEYVNQVEAFRQRQSAAIGQTQQAVPGRSREDAPGSAAGKAGVQPAFRVVQDGEQRMEGTLERISCLAGGAVSFHIRSAAGAEVLHAPKVEAVDFSKHRDDLPDRIGCGPLEEPWRVYVTWRPGATGIRTVVAIEVLPK